MLELDSARQAILRELDAAIGRLETVAPQDWDRPTRCEGWTVRHVAKHLNGGPAIMSEAFTRMRRRVLAARRGGDKAGSAAKGVCPDEARDPHRGCAEWRSLQACKETLDSEPLVLEPKSPG